MITSPETTPPPGSDAAIEKNCQCPRIDNNRGAGYLGQPGVFWITEECPLHDRAPEPEEP
jgi:hypothetical protein